MARILLLFFVVLLVWLAVRIVAGRRREESPPPPRGALPSDPNAVEAIAQCAWCGVHVPAGTALSLPDGRVYCGVAHRDAAHAASS